MTNNQELACTCEREARNDNYKQLDTIILDVLMDIQPEDIQPEALLFDDLGCDSLDFVDITGRIERTYRIPFKFEELATELSISAERLTVGVLKRMIRYQLEKQEPENVRQENN